MPEQSINLAELKSERTPITGPYVVYSNTRTE